MTDDDAKALVDAPAEEAKVEPEVPAPAEAPQAAEAPVEEPQETPEEAPGPETEEPELTPGQQERVEEAKAKGMDPLRLEKLISNMTQPKERPAPARPEALDYRALDADEETVKTLESDRQAYGEKLYSQGLDQARAIEFRTMLEIDAPRVETKYPQLEGEAGYGMNSLYLRLVGYQPGDSERGIPEKVTNPGLRYRDFADAYMADVERLASHKTAESTKNIARQSAQTAIRPTGQAQKLNLNKPASEMNDEELKAVNDRIVKQLKK